MLTSLLKLLNCDFVADRDILNVMIKAGALKPVLRFLGMLSGFLFLGWEPAIILFGYYTEFFLDGILDVIAILVSATPKKLPLILSNLFVRTIQGFLYTLVFLITDVFLFQTHGSVYQVMARVRGMNTAPDLLPDYPFDMLSVVGVGAGVLIVTFLLDFRNIRKDQNVIPDPIFNQTSYRLHFAMVFGLLTTFLFLATEASVILTVWPYVMMGVVFWIDYAFCEPLK